jgi:hypothetical protein
LRKEVIKMVVIGAMHGEFKDRNTGKKISYAKLYVTYPFNSSNGKIPDGCIGQKCEALNVPLSVIDSVKVGDEIEPVYNRYGRVKEVIVKNKKLA